MFPDRVEFTTRTPRSQPPPRPDYLLLIARWKGLMHPAYGIVGGPWLGHTYTLATWPDEPIIVGRKVKILAASPVAHHRPETPLNELDTHDPHVMGRVVEIRRMEDGVATARIVNECRGNMVEEVELQFPYLLQKGPRPERRASRREMAEAEVLAEEALDPLACVRPMPAGRECRGRDCWLKSNAKE